MSVVSLRDYINQFCGRELLSNDKIIPHVRWYARLKYKNFAWSDVTGKVKGTRKLY